MTCRRIWAKWLGLAVGVCCLTGTIYAQEDGTRIPSPNVPPQSCLALGVPLDQLPAGVRDSVRQVVEQPTLTSRGPTEAFHGRPSMYLWLLDHPDQAVLIWRRLGAKCLDITSQGQGRFAWTDGQGSNVHWETVQSGPDQRIWYAEGNARPSPLLPVVPVRAVVVLHYLEGQDSLGRPMIRHHAD